MEFDASDNIYNLAYGHRELRRGWDHRHRPRRLL